MLKTEEMCHLLDIDEAKYEKAIDKYTLGEYNNAWLAKAN